MEKKRIWLSSPTMHGEEQKFIQEAFDANWIAPLGKNVDKFEQETAAYIGVGHGAALVSGTAAIHLAVKLANVRPGDIVLCSDLTFIASVNPVSYERGVPVFVDSEPESWNMDPRALETALRKYRGKVKAVIAVNLYGTPARLDEIADLCRTYEAVLIEDAAESLSAVYKGRQTGSFGMYGCVSFNGNKIITSSGGGMLLSDQEPAVLKARRWSAQAREPAPWYQHRELGYNYRMSNLVAGVGRGQLLHIDEHRAKKKAIYEHYRKRLAELPLTMNPCPEHAEPNFWISCILLDKKAVESKQATPEKLWRALAAENIESRPIWKPMHQQPLYAKQELISLKEEAVSDDIFERGLCLPSDIKMTEEEQEQVIQIIKNSICN